MTALKLSKVRAVRLYGARTGQCKRAAVAFVGAGIGYEAAAVDIRAREHKEPAYRAMNPRGLVSTMAEQRREGDDLILTQSLAIMLYAAKHSSVRLMPGPGSDQDTFFDRWFHFSTEVIAPDGNAFVLRGGGDENGSEMLTTRALEALIYAERFLLGSRHMAGDNFSLVDIAAYTCAFAYRDSLDWRRLPLLHAWYEMVKTRGGVCRGMEVFSS